MDYLNLLNDGYEESKQLECTPSSRAEFLATNLFEFCTYDSGMDELLGVRALEVFQAISERKTFEYIADPEQYRWYIVMCNMPFFANRIDWGTSIRGAWWSSNQKAIDSCGLYHDLCSEEWEAFASAVLAFAKG